MYFLCLLLCSFRLSIRCFSSAFHNIRFIFIFSSISEVRKDMSRFDTACNITSRNDAIHAKGVNRLLLIYETSANSSSMPFCRRKSSSLYQIQAVSQVASLDLSLPERAMPKMCVSEKTGLRLVSDRTTQRAIQRNTVPAAVGGMLLRRSSRTFHAR